MPANDYGIGKCLSSFPQVRQNKSFISLLFCVVLQLQLNFKSKLKL